MGDRSVRRDHHSDAGGRAMTTRCTAGTELAHRSSAGIDVTLLWIRSGCADETVVCVTDHREGTCFEIPAPASVILDVYYHPFAYRDLSTGDHEDRRLAA